MYPSYPSKTFPNHYTIATGLYPGSHGIFDRYLYDPTISPALEDISKTKQNGYFKGEPIWSSVVRQQRKMNCLMWPGCSFNITGFNPTVDVPYNKNLTYSARVQMVNLRYPRLNTVVSDRRLVKFERQRASRSYNGLLR